MSTNTNLESVTAVLTQTEKKQNELECQMKSFESSLSKLKGDNWQTYLTNQLTSIKQQIAEMEATLKQRQNENKKLTQQRDLAKNQIQDLTRKIRKAHEKKEDLTLPKLTGTFVQVTPINTGTLQLSESIMIENGKNVKHEITCLVYLIEHPQHGAILFDLGFSKEIFKENYGNLSKHSNFLSKWNIKPVDNFQSLAEYIEENSKYKASDIKNLIVSHHHWDHCGDAQDFPNAKLIMGKGVNQIRSDVCITCSKKHPGYFGFELPVNKEIIEVEWTKDLKVGPFHQCTDLYGDGTVFIVDCDGHVPGHIGLIAKHEKGWVLLCGDGVYSSDSYNNKKPKRKGLYGGKPADHDPERAYETICDIHKFYHMDNTMVRQAHFKTKDSYAI